MTDPTELLSRITVDPELLGGKPTIRGLRIAAEQVLGMLAAGDSPETIRAFASTSCSSQPTYKPA